MQPYCCWHVNAALRKTLDPRLAATVAALTLTLTGCAATPAQPEGLQVVASTGVLANLATAIACPAADACRAQVSSLVPPGADPHSYEPSLRDVRDVAYADVAFTNGLLLEQQKLVKTVEANLPAGAQSVAVAENIESYGGQLIPIVEDASLDSLWLGLRTEGVDSTQGGEVRFEVSRVLGPGQASAFITGTFGAVEMVANSAARGAEINQVDDASEATGDLGGTDLPLQAHTHLSWAFTQPGFYEFDISAAPSSDDRLQGVKPTTVHFAVGIDPAPLAARLGEGTQVLGAGHADLTAQLGEGRLSIRTDGEGEPTYYDPESTVLAVPSRTLQELPAGSQYRFLGKPGSQVYLLAQAVLGKHVHGEIDPHIWHSVPNMMAAAQLMRDTLISADPAGAKDYRANTEALLAELARTDTELRQVYGQLPDTARNLITTHDGYRYLASEYGLTIAGYVSPGPGVEPSIQQRERLRRTIEDAGVTGLYTENGILSRTPVLEQVGEEAGVQVCQLYSDALDAQAPTYSAMMLRNAQTVAECGQ